MDPDGPRIAITGTLSAPRLASLLRVETRLVGARDRRRQGVDPLPALLPAERRLEARPPLRPRPARDRDLDPELTPQPSDAPPEDLLGRERATILGSGSRTREGGADDPHVGAPCQARSQGFRDAGRDHAHRRIVGDRLEVG